MTVSQYKMIDTKPEKKGVFFIQCTDVEDGIKNVRDAFKSRGAEVRKSSTVKGFLST